MRCSIKSIAACMVAMVCCSSGWAAEETPYVANLSPPPEKFAISAGGVDIRTGRYTLDETDLSIGDDSGGLTLTRILSSAINGHIDPFANFAHNWDITLVEKRIDIAEGEYSVGTGSDFRLTVNFAGRSETFQGYASEAESFQISRSPYARLTSVGNRSSSGVIYTFQASGGTRVIFRALGGSDCTTGGMIRCAFASQVIRADGTQFDLAYETAAPVSGQSSGARLRSVVSNRGYALLLEYSGTGALWNMVTKACVLNLTQVGKPTNNVCPGSAVATTQYTYTTFGGKQKLATVVDAVGGSASYGYSSISGTSVTGAPSTFYAMTFTKPGQATAWQTLNVALTTSNEGALDQLITAQSFADGSSYSYAYALTPQVDGEFSSVAGGTIIDALSNQTMVEYGFPVLPQPFNPPRASGLPNIGDTLYQTTPGPTKITDPLGRITQMDYCDPNAMAGLPQWVTDRCLVTNVQSSTDPEGIKVTYTFSLGHLIQTRRTPKLGSPLAEVVRSVGDNCLGNLTLCGKPQTATDAKGKITDLTYNSTHGGVLTVTLPAPTSGAVRPQERYTYTQLYAWYKNSAGTLVQAATPVWMLTQISECRTLASCTSAADETRATITYGTPGTPNNLLPTSVTVASGTGAISATTTKTYDDQGNLLTVDGPLSGAADTTRYRYDAMRRVVGEASPDPDGGGALPHRAVRNTYSAAGDLIKVERGTVLSQSDGAWAAFLAQQAVETDYDTQARKTREKLTAGGITYTLTQYSYDQARRLECTAVRMDPAQWNSQTNACSPQTTGPNGPDRVTRNFYDAAGQLTKRQLAVGTTLQTDEQIYIYTANGRTQTVRDGENNLTTYEYDGLDRLSKTRFPAPAQGAIASSTTDFEQQTYDPNDNVTQLRLRDGQLIGSTYDNLNRRTLKDLPTPEADVSYTYDLQSRSLNTTQASASVTQTHDALGRMLTESTAQGTMTYEYDAASRRTRTTWPDNFYVTQDFLVTGEVSAIRESGAGSGVGVLATFSYDSLGHRSSISRGNGTTTTFGHDPVSRLTSLAQNLSGTAQDVSSAFSYNPASQLVSWRRSNDVYAWTAHSNQNKTYAINGLNAITSVGGITFSYDGRLNLTNQGTGAYGYTAENRLVSAPNGAAFSYDPLGRLQQSSGSSGTTRFQYDGTDLVAEYNSSNQLLRRYVHGPGSDEPLVWYEGSGTSDRRWLHQDERSSTVAVSSSSGSYIALNSYDEYGRPGASNLGRFQYTGQTWLPEVGMYYYKARIYAPSLGRFLQTDPIGYDDGLNLYVYAHDDPANRTDPDGTESPQIVGGEYSPVPAEIDEARFRAGSEFIGGVSGITDAADAVSSAQQGDYGPAAKSAAMAAVGAKLKVPAKLGSYMIRTTKGLWYAGKGPIKRFMESVKRIMKETGEKIDPKKSDWKPSKPNTDDQAFVDEYRRMQKAGGVDDPQSLNKIESPGKKIEEELRKKR